MKRRNVADAKRRPVKRTKISENFLGRSVGLTFAPTAKCRKFGAFLGQFCLFLKVLSEISIDVVMKYRYPVYLLLIKIAIYLCPSYGRNLQPSKENIQLFKK
jgi:hypothetical protein